MFFYFDESGDYSFPEDGFDCYVQAVVICPNRVHTAVNAYVDGLKQKLAVNELHACDLAVEQLVDICRFVASSPCELLANITDNRMVTGKGIFDLRLAQASIYKRNLDWYRQRGGGDDEWEAHMQRQIKRAALASQISDSEFIQAHFMVFLIADALNKALARFHQDQWRDEFDDFIFVLDGKLPNKLGYGEKYLDACLLPALSSRGLRGALHYPQRWKEDPVHPFVNKYREESGQVRGEEVSGVISLDRIFRHGLLFESSHDHAGLQLADVVAAVIRGAVLNPKDALARAAYEELRPKLPHRDGRCLDVRGVASGIPVPQDRYGQFVRVRHLPERPRRSGLVVPGWA